MEKESRPALHYENRFPTGSDEDFNVDDFWIADVGDDSLYLFIKTEKSWEYRDKTEKDPHKKENPPNCS